MDFPTFTPDQFATINADDFAALPIDQSYFRRTLGNRNGNRCCNSYFGGSMSYFIKQSSATRPLLFLIVSSTDHISPATGLTPTVTISKSGGSFATPSGSVTEIANGWYQVAANATDSGTLGPLILHATASGADPTDSIYRVVAFDPDSATNLGLSGLPTASPAASGGIPTVGTGSGQINPDGTGAVPTAFGTPLPSSPLSNTVGEALFFADIIGGRVNTAQGGTSTTITLDAGASSDTNAYVGDNIFLYGGTGGDPRSTGQRRTITAYNTSTKVASVQRAWDTIPDSTTKFITLPQPQANVGLWNNVAVGVALPGSGTLSTYAGGAVASVTAPVELDMTQAVPTSNTAQTVGDALNAARADGFGKWVFSGTTLTLYAGDGVTVVRTFTLDSATNPGRRS